MTYFALFDERDGRDQGLDGRSVLVVRSILNGSCYGRWRHGPVPGHDLFEFLLAESMVNRGRISRRTLWEKCRVNMRSWPRWVNNGRRSSWRHTHDWRWCNMRHQGRWRRNSGVDRRWDMMNHWRWRTDHVRRRRTSYKGRPWGVSAHRCRRRGCHSWALRHCRWRLLLRRRWRRCSRFWLKSNWINFLIWSSLLTKYK